MVHKALCNLCDNSDRDDESNHSSQLLSMPMHVPGPRASHSLSQGLGRSGVVFKWSAPLLPGKQQPHPLSQQDLHSALLCIIGFR